MNDFIDRITDLQFRELAATNPAYLRQLVAGSSLSFGDLARAISAVSNASDAQPFADLLVKHAVTHQSYLVREASILALAYADSPLVRETLHRIVKDGPLKILQETAADVLDDLINS